jgi:hypothetical protein
MKILKRIRALFWFVRVDPWRMWKYLARHGPRIQVFRNRRYPKGYKNWEGTDIGGARMYITYRWGGQVLGLQVGDRGHSREFVRREMGLES